MNAAQNNAHGAAMEAVEEAVKQLRALEALHPDCPSCDHCVTVYGLLYLLEQAVLQYGLYRLPADHLTPWEADAAEEEEVEPVAPPAPPPAPANPFYR